MITSATSSLSNSAFEKLKSEFAVEPPPSDAFEPPITIERVGNKGEMKVKR
jgi:hypothetical protein